MKRVIFIVKKEDDRNIKEIASVIKNNLKDVKLVDVRKASNHIELDLFCSELDAVKKALQNFFKLIDSRVLEEEVKEDRMELAKRLFNEERFWEVHEVLEYLWRKATGDEKRMLHGIILLAASMVHNQKSRKEVAISIMKRAYLELEPYNLNYKGFDLALIKRKIEEMLKSGIIEPFKIT